MTPRTFAVLGLTLVPLVIASVLALPREGTSIAAIAQGTGSITGQVTWCTPLLIRAGFAEGETTVGVGVGVAQEAGAARPPEVQPDGTVRPPGPIPMPIPRPTPPRPIPAGAVLVAVQNTSLSARTDESGNFRIDGVPVGQYYTVAAGPVRNAPAATGMRPNVFVSSAGETVNVGQITLGGPCAFGPIPLGAPGATEGQPGETP